MSCDTLQHKGSRVVDRAGRHARGLHDTGGGKDQDRRGSATGVSLSLLAVPLLLLVVVVVAAAVVVRFCDPSLPPVVALMLWGFRNKSSKGSESDNGALRERHRDGRIRFPLPEVHSFVTPHTPSPPAPPVVLCQQHVTLRCGQLEDNEERLLGGLRAASLEGNHASEALSHLRSRPKIEPQILAVSCKHQQASPAGYRTEPGADPSRDICSTRRYPWLQIGLDSRSQPRCGAYIAGYSDVKVCSPGSVVCSVL